MNASSDRSSIEAARAAFPSGLEQPKGSFRFSQDALLLAGFAAEHTSSDDISVAELGTGCGVVSLALLLARPSCRAVGLERESVLTEAAGHNAAMLGLTESFTSLTGDVASREDLRRMREILWEEKKDDAGVLPMFDLVVANPPWRTEGSGRIPPSDMRRRALFGDKETFPSFFRAADALLKNGGILAAVSGADRTTEIIAALPARLHPEVLRFVLTKDSAPAEFVLLLARKNGRGALRVEKA
ncbi:MAG: methyltransferase [Mailhella sp.]|nr:methyltransferase [Mailhella sp.]